MEIFWETMREHQVLLRWLGIASLAMFVGSLIVTPILIARLPADYFTRPLRVLPLPGRPPVLRWTAFVLKNLVGIVLVVAGIAMLVLPGQGVLSICIGVMVMNFPGKRALESRLIHGARVLRVMNWVRARAGVPPLRV